MTLAAVSKDVRFYKWPNINYVGIYENPVDGTSIKSISWSCNGRKVMVVKSKGSPVIVEVPYKKERVDVTDCTYVNHVSVGVFANTSSDLVAYGNEEGYVSIYNTKHARRPRECLKISAPIQNIDFSSDDNLLAVGGVSGPIILFDSNYKPCASFLIPNEASLSILTFSKYCKNLLAASNKDCVLSLWNTETTDILFANKHHSGRITDVAFFENGLSTVGTDSKYVRYDLRSYKATCSVLDCPLSSLAYLNGTNELAVSTVSGQIRSYDSRNMKCPLKTLVTNNGIKKISFPFYSDVDSRCNRAEEDDYSASGDFNIPSSSNPRRSQVSNKNVVAVTEDESSTTNYYPRGNLEEINKVLEDKLNIATKEFEEKLIQTFYKLRIGTSKQFISLEEKISQNWNSFVDYLKQSGQGPCTSTVDIPKSCYSLGHSNLDSEINKD